MQSNIARPSQSGSERRSVTIIVAASQSMGMSFKRRLPWPRLQRENAYFHNTTKRVPTEGTLNAVIFGYNTWDKTPTKYYLGRINVVITKDPEEALQRLSSEYRNDFVHVATDINTAVELLERTYPYPDNGFADGHVGAETRVGTPYLGRIFVIGGAGLCREALSYSWVDRLLLTRVICDFKADTFFPLVLGGRGNEEWRRQDDQAFQNWGGDEVPIGVQFENGLEWQTFMFERA
ncbi:dihydrofolate reductase [Mollisia scopiformis]|uniref:Dihydrofolate reductase n=1 Tax=Mollisia scopiformis TaxID=149040 RepID=A0A194X246_MOLSC|nr:dihydrofolate reductase [Mollisia scopiformis]KUJ14069.1 dihydrofolate reductase [Mollisia scopiformis]